MTTLCNGTVAFDSSSYSMLTSQVPLSVGEGQQLTVRDMGTNDK